MDIYQILTLIFLAILIITVFIKKQPLSQKGGTPNFLNLEQSLENNKKDLKEFYEILNKQTKELNSQNQYALTDKIMETRRELKSNIENSLKVLKDQNTSGFQDIKTIRDLFIQRDKTGQAGEILLNRILENISYLKDKLIF